MRAKERATIAAHPAIASVRDPSKINAYVRTIEPRLQSSMFARTALTVVIVNDERPRMAARLEPLRHCRDGVGRGLRRSMLVVERDVHLAALVVDSSDDYSGMNPVR